MWKSILQIDERFERQALPVDVLNGWRSCKKSYFCDGPQRINLRWTC